MWLGSVFGVAAACFSVLVRRMSGNATNQHLAENYSR